MTLTNEQIEVFAKRIAAFYSLDWQTCQEAAAALRQLAEERDKEYDLLCNTVNQRNDALEQAHTLRQERDDLKADYLRRNQEAADFAIRLRQLEEERDREDRLLRAGWILTVVGTQFCWESSESMEKEGIALHPDRSTAARLAADKLEKP